MDLKNLTIKKAHDMIEKKEISVSDLVGAYKKVIDEKNGDINAYLEVFADADDVAKKYDNESVESIKSKPLFGIPFAVKDNMLVKGRISSAGSKILENYHGTYDATVIKKLKDAGAIFLGRTNMDEFAMGSSTENSSFGVTKNPYDLERVPGGSSGGSAAAVAMDGCLASLGSDTGGSIRQPASFCGIVGLKPTYGAVSRYGLIAMASSLDQIGVFSKTVGDSEIVFDVISGKDPKDSTSVDYKYGQSLSAEKKLKVGVLKYDKKMVDDDINKAVDEAANVLKGLGHEVKEISLNNLEYSLPCYYIIMPAEVSTNLARFDGIKYGLSKSGENLLDVYMNSKGEGFGRETRRRIILGTYILSAGHYDAYYTKAQKVRAMIKNEFVKAFGDGGVDAILMPTTPTTAFKIGEKSSDPIQMYFSDTFTVSANLAGIPAISIPFGKSNGLPMSVQLASAWFREDILFSLGKQLTKED